MTNNKPNDVRVPSDLIERAMLACFEAGHGITHDELRAILAQPSDQQGEPFAWASIYTGFNDHADADSEGFRVVAFHQNPNAPELETHIPLYRHAQPATAKVDENTEFEIWRNDQIESLERMGYQDAAKAFRNLGSVHWTGWQARANLKGGQS